MALQAFRIGGADPLRYGGTDPGIGGGDVPEFLWIVLDIEHPGIGRLDHFAGDFLLPRVPHITARRSPDAEMNLVIAPLHREQFAAVEEYHRFAARLFLVAEQEIRLVDRVDRSVGTRLDAPAILAKLRYMSSIETISLLVRPGVTWPGQRTMKGTRMAPSHPLGNSPRNGPESLCAP